MAGIPNNLGDNDQAMTDPKRTSGTSLVNWCVGKVRAGRDHRDEFHEARWKEYTRLWRGFHAEKDKNSNSERSKLIAPALSQAIEMTVSEIEEAIFGRRQWFEVTDDIEEDDKVMAGQTQRMLLEDFESSNIQGAINSIALLGAIYGTGIGKINVGMREDKRIVDGEVMTEDRFMVTLEPVRPDEFVIDPSARNVTEALYVAHEVVKPLNVVQSKQASGIYLKGQVRPYTGNRQADWTGRDNETTVSAEDEGVYITEYFGLVPAKFIEGAGDGTGMVEAIVTIANETTLLKAVKSPFMMEDRPIVAYQHDTVPGEFWGRGVSEKGYNPQKALDAELRARNDGLALVTAPMLGADVTKLPRNPDLRVRPGKVFLTRGRPSDIIEPVGFSPQSLALSFQQSGDLERMVQVGTGAMDTATPVGGNRRNETSSGMSQMQAGFLKRSKRTMRNIETSFLQPFLRKSLWRYVQFAPTRYQQDYTFVPKATLGIMAKEVETQQLVQMLGFVPADSPAHPVLIQAIFSNTTSSEKAELQAAVEAMTQGPSEQEQQMQQMQQQMQMQAAQLELAAKQLENAKLEADIALVMAKTKHELVNTELEDEKIEIAAANTAIGAEKARVTARQTDVAADRNDIEREKVRSDNNARGRES
tara:strand:- start:4879 stop:6813 length:1935 start_codon:yes stop_codon:yes gene_type:complete